MAKASTYATDATITGLDKFLGTDAADSSTKNFTITNLETFLAGNGVLSIPAGTETLTNKTIDGDNNTITNLAHGAEVDNPTSGVHGVTGSVVGTTDTQTLTNKTMDFSTGGTNVLTADSSDIDYDNGVSGLAATNTKAALDELDADIATVESDVSAAESDIAQLQNQTLAYITDVNASTSLALNSSFQWAITQVGGGGATAVSLSAAGLAGIDANAVFAIQRSDVSAVSITFSGVTILSQPAGTYSLDAQGDIMWFIKVNDSTVAVWGDFTIT